MRQPQEFGCGHNTTVRSPTTLLKPQPLTTAVTMVTRRADECFSSARGVPPRPLLAQSELPTAARSLWGTGPGFSAERELLRIPLPAFYDVEDGLLVLELDADLNDRLHRQVLDDNAGTTIVRFDTVRSF